MTEKERNFMAYYRKVKDILHAVMIVRNFKQNPTTEEWLPI